LKKDIFNAEFLTTVAVPGQFPGHKYPEVSFSGRSNVGKSSLINSIAARKKLAYTSATPGKTETLNFFLIDSSWCLVDMPGYGFVAKGQQYREKWATLNLSYLTTRTNLNLACILIDSRHDPMPQDIAMIETLENAGKAYLIVLTKCDKIKEGVINARTNQLRGLVAQCQHCVDILPYSSVSGKGRNELIGIIKRFVRGDQQPIERVNL